MISRLFLPPSPGPYRFWRFNHGGRVRDGRFEVHGLDPDAEVPIHFFEPKGGLGATTMFSGKSGADGPLTVRLEPCGSARARLVDRDGKPVAGFPGRRLLSIVVTPGAPLPRRDLSGPPAADEAAFAAIDPTHYENGPVSDADGRIVLPALIPGATYSARALAREGGIGFHKDFTVKPGETIDLGEIPVERPPG
jgi:hypothetical protein